ncbi:zinc finger BED domain-containing protein 6-like [Lissotriton helveticus]
MDTMPNGSKRNPIHDDEIQTFPTSSGDSPSSSFSLTEEEIEWKRHQLQEYVPTWPSIETKRILGTDHILSLVNCPSHSLTTLNIDGNEGGNICALSISSTSSESICSEEEPIVHNDAMRNDVTASEEDDSRSWLLTEEAFCESEKCPRTHERVRLFNSKLAKMLIVDVLPLSFVENKGLLELIAAGAQEWEVPSCRFFAETALPELYHQVLSQLCKALKQMVGKKLHLTTNIWSSADMAIYLCVTAHWVSFRSFDAGFASHGTASHSVRKQAVLCMQLFEEEYLNAQDIASKLDHVIKDWFSPRFLQAEFVTCDNNPNFLNALKILNIKPIPCFARTLSLVVIRFLTSSPDIVDLLTTARKICSHFSHSHRALKALSVYQKQYNLPKHRIKLDAPNRWKSTLHMLERLHEQRKAIIKYTMSTPRAKDLKGTALTESQWKLNSFLCKILSPFEEATVRASREEAGISEILPLICLLENSLITVQHECGQHNEKLSEMTNKMLSSLTDDACIKYIKDNDHYMLATFLDPRFRDQVSRMTSCQSPEVTIQRCKDILQTRLQSVLDLKEHEYRKGTAVPSTSSGTLSLVPKVSHQSAKCSDTISKSSRLWSQLSNISLLSTGRITPDNAHAMVAAYMQDVYVIDVFEEPLHYWKGKEEFWPLLSRVAVEILGCPPTTVQPKRVIRAAQAVLNAKEICEYTEKMSRLTFLRMNHHLLPNDYILLPEQIPDSAAELETDDEDYYRL